MTETLLQLVHRHADANVRPGDLAHTPISGLTTIRSPMPTGLAHAISHPLICLVLQGEKQVTIGARTFTFGAGDSLLITADVPIVSQITRASPEAPYCSLALNLDSAVIAELTEQMEPPSPAELSPVQVDPTDSEVADVALRLIRLLDRPASVPVLHGQLVRELHYWLLMGKHGAAIRRLGWPDSHFRRIARAVSLLRARYTEALPVEGLAAEAGMSPSSFHQHFRAVTSLSPLQFQKQLRLIEARRLMTAEALTAASAAFAVGYESVPQFTREYRRLFGQPPATDAKMARRTEAA